MTSVRDRDGDVESPAEPAWHERTGTLAGASIGAVIVLALLYFLISTMAREFNDPSPTPQYFIEPSSTSGPSQRDATTTTETITSTSPPVTTDINPGDPAATTPGSETTSSSTSYPPGATRPPRTRDPDATTTRSRPRLNETRTLYPRP